jgi:PAS domain S-box-containing protein
MQDHAREHLASIVASSDDAILSKTLEGIIQSWNVAAERMFGYTAGEVIGKSIRIIIPADRQSEEDDVLARLRRGERIDHFETIRQHKDGSLIHVSLTVSPVRDASGRIIGASKIARDITGQKRAAAELAAAQAKSHDLEQRLSALVAASSTLLATPDLAVVLPRTMSLARELVNADAYAIWRFDPDQTAWRVLDSFGVSAAFAATVVEKNDTVAAGPLEFLDARLVADIASDPLVAERAAALTAEGFRSLLTCPMMIDGAANGTIVFYGRAARRFDEVDARVGQALANLVAIGITTSGLIARRELANRQAAFLAEAGATLASSLDYGTTLQTVARLAVPQFADWCAVDITNESGVAERVAVAHADPAKIALAEQLQAQYPETAESPNAVTRVLNTLEPILVERVTPQMIEAAARSEEHLAALRAMQLTSYIVVPLIAHGRALGALVFANAESRRTYGTTDLRFAQEVGYRAALAVDNARAYNRMLLANRAKDDFLATLSHELRTPLNAVLGWARMLRAGDVRPEKVERALEVIEQSATAQTRLVEDLLDVSRIVTGKFRLEFEPVDLAAAVHAAISAVGPAAAAKAIAIDASLDRGAPALEGDPARLQQAVWNLLSNAIKFTPKGGAVHVLLASRDNAITIEVTDTGEGISPDALPHIFERFHQGDSGPTRSFGGLGLGLAIVRHIVVLHGGRVEARSQGAGHGATFVITLPVAAAREPSRPAAGLGALP